MAHGNWRSIAPKSFSVGVPLALGGEVADYRQLGSTSWALALAIPEQRAPGSIRAAAEPAHGCSCVVSGVFRD